MKVNDKGYKTLQVAPFYGLYYKWFSQTKVDG